MEAFSMEQYGPAMVERLREQVNNIMAAIQLLSPVVREQGDARYEQYLAIANQSLYRLLRMMNNVDFAQKSEQGGQTPVFCPAVLDAAGFCRELARQVEPLAARAGVAFRYEESTGSLLLPADGGLLRRMLLNLISNALQAAGPGGRAGLRLSTDRDRAVFTVWDSGRRADGGWEGLGLGLIIARQIAALHGGGIVFECGSEQGGRAAASLPAGVRGGTGALRTPRLPYDATGGFSPVLVELSDALPYEAFASDDVE